MWKKWIYYYNCVVQKRHIKNESNNNKKGALMNEKECVWNPETRADVNFKKRHKSWAKITTSRKILFFSSLHTPARHHAAWWHSHFPAGRLSGSTALLLFRITLKSIPNDRYYGTNHPCMGTTPAVMVCARATVCPADYYWHNVKNKDTEYRGKWFI